MVHFDYHLGPLESRPVVPNRGAANSYFSLFFTSIKLARGAAKCLKYLVRVPRTKKRLGNTGLDTIHGFSVKKAMFQ